MFSKITCLTVFLVLYTQPLSANSCQSLFGGPDYQVDRYGWLGRLISGLGGQIYIDQGIGQRVFNITNRNYNALLRQMFYPKELIRLEGHRGKAVLDMGTGGGKFVEDLRRVGANAFGLDIFLNENQKNKPYFIEADILNTGLNSDSYDIIYFNYSLPSYEIGKSAESNQLAEAAIREAKRLVKTGGVIRISPLDVEVRNTETGVAFLKNSEVLFTIEGLAVTAKPDAEWKNRVAPLWSYYLYFDAPSPMNFVELQRID